MTANMKSLLSLNAYAFIGNITLSFILMTYILKEISYLRLKKLFHKYFIKICLTICFVIILFAIPIINIFILHIFFADFKKIKNNVINKINTYIDGEKYG